MPEMKSEKMVHESYFWYLISIINDERDICSNYNSLLQKLYSTEFIWSNPMDSNRAVDGLDLRYTFAKTTAEKKWVLNVLCDIDESMEPNSHANVLEVLVALAKRIEDDIMHRELVGDRTSIWFWAMIRNSGLYEITDSAYIDSAKTCDNYVEYRLDCIMNRKYESNGFGGLFPLIDPKEDQRNVEIWYQMAAWINEFYCIDDITL